MGVYLVFYLACLIDEPGWKLDASLSLKIHSPNASLGMIPSGAQALYGCVIFGEDEKILKKPCRP